MATNYKTKISAKVLPSTLDFLNKICGQNGTEIGDLIDRLALNYETQTIEGTAQLILEDMISHTKELSSRQIEKVFYIVITAVRDSLIEETTSSDFKKSIYSAIMLLERAKRG